MTLPTNAIDEIKEYDPTNLKMFADLQRKNIEIELILLKGVRNLQQKFSKLGDQIILDTIFDGFKKTNQINTSTQLGIMSLACYKTEQLYKIISRLQEIQNATNDIFERYQNRADSENSQCANQQSTS